MKYRREIDGLRAVAVLPVILFHAGFSAFSGGFVGVDIFFVISGYLITTIILSDMELGKFSLVTFYERRARRILPALFFVMFCCLPFAWFWLAPAHLKDFSQSLTAVSVFSSNILFWYESGYFAPAAELLPLLHTWSLSVEEQYYLLFPLFLMLLWRLKKRWIFAILIIIAVVSLATAQWGAYNKPSAAFFLLPARGWELAIGALIAFYFLYKKKQHEIVAANKIASEFLGLLGLGLIIYSIIAFDESTPFPSVYALVPTIGTALIILFSTAETAVGRFLGTKVMVGIGLISYSTYLWHQPLFVFARHRSLVEPGTSFLLTLSAVSIGLAYLSWRFVEEPFRNKNRINRKSIFVFSLVGSLFFATIGLAGHIKNGYSERFNLPLSLVYSFKENSLEQEIKKNNDKSGSKGQVFTFGSEPSEAVAQVAVFGDSHASAMLPAFEEAGRNLNYSFTFMGRGGCPPLLDVDVERGNYNIGVCKQLAEQEYEYVKDHNIKKVFLISRWSLYTDDQPDNTKMYNHFLTSEKSRDLNRSSSRISFEYGVKKTVERYKKIGTQVFIVLQVPQHEMSAYDIYCKSMFFQDSKKTAVIENMSTKNSSHEQFQKYNRDIFKQYIGTLNLISLDSIFCHEGICKVGDKDNSYYRDDDHLSVYGAKLAAAKIREELVSSPDYDKSSISGPGRVGKGGPSSEGLRQKLYF